MNTERAACLLQGERKFLWLWLLPLIVGLLAERRTRMALAMRSIDGGV